MRTNTKRIYTILLFSFIGINSFGQIGRLTDAVKNKKESTNEEDGTNVFVVSPEKKVLKSPAKEQIQKVETSIKELDVLLIEKAYKDAYFAESQDNYTLFMNLYNQVVKGLPEIQKADPKWKASEIYEVKLKDYEVRSKSINALWEKNKKLNVIKLWLREKYDFENNQGDKYLKFGPANKKSCRGLKHAPTMFPEGCPCAQNFREFYLNKMELPLLMSKLKELEDLDGNSYSGSENEWLRELKKTYVTTYDDWESGVMTNAKDLLLKLDNTKTMYKKSMVGLLDYHKEMLFVFNEINPSNANLESLAKEIEAAVDTYRATQRSKYKWTEERSGKVFFLNEKVSLEDFSENDIQNEITLDEPIRLRWFFEKPAVEYHGALGFSTFKNQAMVYYRVFVDDKEFYETGELLYHKNPDELYKDALTTRIKFPFGSKARFYNKIIEDLGLGKHELKVEILIGQDDKLSDVLASGKVSLNLTKNAIDKLLKNEDFCFPASERNDSNLEAKMLDKFNQKGWKEKAQKVIILDKDWTVVRNEYTGVIIKRTINALIVSTTDGECVKEDFMFIQKHNGSSFSGDLEMAIGSKKEMSCKCL